MPPRRRSTLGTWTILNDFAAIREADLTHPLMDQIEDQIAAARESI